MLGGTQPIMLWISGFDGVISSFAIAADGGAAAPRAPGYPGPG